MLRTTRIAIPLLLAFLSLLSCGPANPSAGTMTTDTTTPPDTTISPADAALMGPAWVASSLEKIVPSEPARAPSKAGISAARNEFESFQVVIPGPASGVSASATPLKGPGTIPVVRLYRAGLIDVTSESSWDGMTGQIPDPLIPDVDDVVGEKRNAFPFDVQSGESRAIWVEVFVPPTAAPGLYTGKVTVTADGKTLAVVPVELTVWGFTLPATSSLRSAFGLNWNDLPAGHGFSASDVGTLATVRARYGQMALDHRISLSHHDDGAMDDLAHFDAYYGPLMDGTAHTTLAGAKQTSVEYLGNLTDTQNMARWASHYRAKGWFDRLFQYTCDEPPYQGCGWGDINPRTQAAKAADPDFRTLLTATIAQADQNGVSAGLDVIVPVINDMDGKSGSNTGNQRPQYNAWLASDPHNELWLYQSCMSHGCGGPSDDGTGWPSYMIDASAVRNRAMQWLDFKYGASGELYWETAFAYSGNPWGSQYEFGGNGDGTLFYPGSPARIGGTTQIPVASIRLKMIRDGMEDYEYLKKVSDLGDPAFAKRIADTLFPTASSTGNVTPAALQNARAQLAQRILQLQGGAAR